LYSLFRDGGEYPRTENLGEFLSLCFIGSQLQFDSFIPTRFGDVNELRVRVEVAYLLLYALKHLNLIYRNAYEVAKYFSRINQKCFK
jgi:hypothetical protein